MRRAQAGRYVADTSSFGVSYAMYGLQTVHHAVLLLVAAVNESVRVDSFNVANEIVAK